jgi:hypothetical protein
MAAVPLQVHHGDLDSQGAAGLTAFEDSIRPIYGAIDVPGGQQPRAVESFSRRLVYFVWNITTEIY